MMRRLSRKGGVDKEQRLNSNFWGFIVSNQPTATRQHASALSFNWKSSSPPATTRQPRSNTSATPLTQQLIVAWSRPSASAPLPAPLAGAFVHAPHFQLARGPSQTFSYSNRFHLRDTLRGLLRGLSEQMSLLAPLRYSRPRLSH